MLTQLGLGAIVTTGTVAIIAIFIALAVWALDRMELKAGKAQRLFRSAAILGGVTVWLLTALTLSVFLWAFAYRVIGAFSSFETALYFAFAAFTTLGFGDVLLPKAWRITAGICAANGLLLFGVCTAFLVEVFRSLIQPSERKRV